MGAMKAVADGLLGINKAADEFSVPRSMLRTQTLGTICTWHQIRAKPLPLERRER